MVEPIEETYFKWLCSRVLTSENSTPSLTYYALFSVLHSTEFIWTVPGDDNRSEDGVDLRDDFLRMSGEAVFDDWLYAPCSIMEMLIALAERAEFETEVKAAEWFWIFLENLRLADFNDATELKLLHVQKILNRFIQRDYSLDGRGGLFPLDNPPEDQRDVEIWYQFCEYLVDQEG